MHLCQPLFALGGEPGGRQGLTNAKTLAAEVERSWPDAAGSMRAGLEEMFTVRRLGVEGTLLRTLMSTNPIESMISIARDTSGNVKRWRDEGDMRRRWCAAGMLAAEKQFRRIKGHRDMGALVAALRHHQNLSQASATPKSKSPHEQRARHPRRLQQQAGQSPGSVISSISLVLSGWTRCSVQ